MLYLSLAKSNIKKSKQTYLPYSITTIFIVVIFYIILSISKNPDLTSESAKGMLIFGSGITGVFATIFLFYINSFLMKKRKAELGLYNVLGLNKWHIIRVMFYEKAILTLFAVISGVIIGIILEKALLLFLLKLIKIKAVFGFYISFELIFITICFFIMLNFIMFICDAVEILRSKTIELLKSKNSGEKEVKAKFILAIIGLGCLISGYYISVTMDDFVADLIPFFIAVVLVMIGTYLLFMSGSIAFLKFLKSRKSIYYKTSNFITISTMLYRMKKNAVGLANICILSTAVIITISTSLSLYIGNELAFKQGKHNDIKVRASIDYTEKAKVDEILKASGLEEKLLDTTLYWSDAIEVSGNKFTDGDRRLTNPERIVKIALSEYNREYNKNIILDKNSALIHHIDGYKYNDLYLYGKKYNVKNIDELDDDNLDEISAERRYTMVVNDDELKDDLTYLVNFNITNKDNIVNESAIINQKLSELDIALTIGNIVIDKEYYDSMYGGFLFIGILIGIIFLFATALIVYYKQVSEGYDDKERFMIMKKVGIDSSEIKKVIKRQVSIVFLSPVILATIHLIFVYPVMTQILYSLNSKNVSVFHIVLVGTVLVFLAVYTLLYYITSKVYYKIVK